MIISNPPKALILLVGLVCLTVLTACSDRVRENCTRNKAPGTVTSSVKCK